MRYYVYILLDTRFEGRFDNPYSELNLKPFYIGRGDRQSKKKRHLTHYEQVIKNMPSAKKTNPHKFNTIKILNSLHYEPNFSIVYETENSQESFSVEKELINFYGKLKNGGILTNIADGGAGGNTIETVDGLKEKLKKINSDRWSGSKNPNFRKNKEDTYSHKSKVSGYHWNKGKVVSEETIHKLKNCRKNHIMNVVKINPITLEEIEIISTKDAISKYNIKSPSALYFAIKNGGLCCGFLWKKQGEVLILSKSKREGYKKPIIVKKKVGVFYKKNLESLEEIFYDSILEASLSTGYCIESIRRKCRDGSSKEGFFRLKNKKYKRKTIKEIKKRVRRISTDGAIKDYESITEAASDIENGKITSIFAVCSGRNKSYKKYKFQYI